MANDTISTATPKQRHEAEQLRLSQEAQEWNEKVQKKHATRDEQVLKKVEQERADAKKQAKEKYERTVEAYEQTVIPAQAARMKSFEEVKEATQKQQVEDRQRREQQQQEEMFRKQQEAISQREAENKARQEAELHQRQQNERKEQELLFRRQIEAEEQRARDTWQQKEAEEKARVLANAERDMLLKKKSESIRKFEEERRWSKLTPQQRLQELMGRIETEEDAARGEVTAENDQFFADAEQRLENVQKWAPKVVCWMANSGYRACASCPRKFDLFHRRHHCRRCGEVVCTGCSQHRAAPAQSRAMYGRPWFKRWPQDSARVCDRCFNDPERADVAWVPRQEILCPSRTLEKTVDVENDWVCVTTA